MPIRKDLRPLYPRNWREISKRVRFERACGKCQKCRRPHGEDIRCVPDGRWLDPAMGTWRTVRGKPARWPDLVEIITARSWKVRLAAAHLDHRPQNCRMRNLRAFCQRCHLLHDLPHHLARRRITYRSRWAIGDLFEGPYAEAAGPSGRSISPGSANRAARSCLLVEMPRPAGNGRIVNRRHVERAPDQQRLGI